MGSATNEIDSLPSPTQPLFTDFRADIAEGSSGSMAAISLP